MTTELITQPQHVVTVYDQLSDPLEFIERMGKVFAQSGAGGCETEAEGKLLALTCISERKPWTEITRTYHFIKGRQSMKASVMLAKLRAAGGEHEWIKDGSDGQEAVLKLTYRGQSVTSRFTMEDAARAKLLKAGGNWEKTPGNMLRARAISNGVDIIAPEIKAGLYTPEEIEDVIAANGHLPSSVAPARTAEQVKSRGEELRRMQQEQEQTEQAQQTQASEIAGTVIDAKEPAPFVADNAADVEESAKIALEIDAALKQIGMSRETFEENLRQKNPTFTKIVHLPPDNARKLLSNLLTRIAATAASPKN